MNNEMLALKIEEERKAKEEADRAQELYFISIQFNSIQLIYYFIILFHKFI